MQNFFSSKLNTILLLVLIVLMVFALLVMSKDRENYSTSSDNFVNPDKDLKNNIEEENSPMFNVNISKEDFMKEESKWAYQNNGIPEGWFKWNEVLNGKMVEKFGPVKNGDSYIIIVEDSLVSSLEIDVLNRCMGDSEISRCAVGDNKEVLRYMEVYKYFY